MICRSSFVFIHCFGQSIAKNSIFAIEYLCMLLPLDKRGRIFLICLRAEKLKATKDKGSEAHSFTFIKQAMKQK